MESDALIQACERALFEAEAAYRSDPSEAHHRRVADAWAEVRRARGEPADVNTPFPWLAPRPAPENDSTSDGDQRD